MINKDVRKSSMSKRSSDLAASPTGDWGQQQRLRRLDDGPEKLATMTEALVEEDEPNVKTTTTKASDEEAEETTCPSERL